VNDEPIDLSRYDENRKKRGPAKGTPSPIKGIKKDPNSGNGFKSPAFVYRCFLMQHIKGNRGWHCRNLMPAFFKDVYQSFVWNAFTDREGLEEYIDDLITGRRSKSVVPEANGIVTECKDYDWKIVPQSPNTHKDPTVFEITVNRFVECMLLRDKMCLPLWGRLRFITDGKRLVPASFIGAMAPLLNKDGDHVDPGPNWKWADEGDLAAMGLQPDDVTSGLYRGQAAPRSSYSTPSSDDAPDVEPQQIEVSRSVGRTHVDLVTLVRPVDGEPFYARRIFLFADSHLLWDGTSFHRNGPWKVWQRDSSRMLAEGIAEPTSI